MCRVLGVSRSGYYHWLPTRFQEPAGRAAQDELRLPAQIEQIHREFRYYGSPRSIAPRPPPRGRHRVARLMRTQRHPCLPGQDRGPTPFRATSRRPEVVDVVHRYFHADAPDLLWFTDITQIRTDQGWLYAAVILDAFNRQVDQLGHRRPRHAHSTVHTRASPKHS